MNMHDLPQSSEMTNKEIVEHVKLLLSQDRSIKEIAGIFGKSHSWVSRFVALKNLHPDLLSHLDQYQERDTRVGTRVARVLSLEVAAQVARMPQDKQCGFVELEISKTGSVSADKGMLKNNTTPGLLYGQVKSFETFLNHFLDMPSLELKRLLDVFDASKKNLLEKTMRDLAFHLQSIANTIAPQTLVRRERPPSMIERYFERQGIQCDWSNWEGTRDDLDGASSSELN